MRTGDLFIHGTLGFIKNMNVVLPIITTITVLLAHGSIQAFSTSDKAPILRVQSPQSQPVLEEATKAPRQAKESENIIKSQNLTLKLAFMADPRLFPYQIDCHVQEKSVELQGLVSLEEEKALASLLTANLIKGKEIINHIEVQPSLSATIQVKSDSRLTDLVKQRFAKSQTLQEANFEIVTIRGVVSLRGRTRFQVIAYEAAQAAREIPGVIAVNTQNIRFEAGND